MTGVDRTVERVKTTGEVFTPTSLVLEMCAYLDPRIFARGKKVLDPACGDGQFLVAAKAIKMHVHGMSAGDALSEIYGVDIMRDNVDLCRLRLGGGTIIMGNTLNPAQALEGQSNEELELMLQLFEQPSGEKSRRKARLGKSLASAAAGSQPESSSPEMLLF
jgi:2-polyprenyl-3-methyl-5-hydroxy-6-metoxy-1,4-benzoquinol methylase